MWAVKSSNGMTSLEEDRQGIWEPKQGRHEIQGKIEELKACWDQSPKMTHLFWPLSCIQMTRGMCVCVK